MVILRFPYDEVTGGGLFCWFARVADEDLYVGDYFIP